MMLPDVVEHSTRTHTNQKGNTEYIATVKVKFTFIDGDSGEELSIHSVGEGQDAGDKAVYKAITGAQKYALMKAFMIPTGDDPEQDSESQQVQNNNSYNNQPQGQRSEAQIKRMYAIGKSAGFSADDVNKVLNKEYGGKKPENLTKSEYDNICNRMEAKKGA